MNRLSFILFSAFGLIVMMAITLQSCQKDQESTFASVKPSKVQNRGSIHYGVTVASAGNPSQLVEMDDSGMILSSTTCFIDNGQGQPIAIDDLKGICYQNGRVLITTGLHPVDAYSELLVEVKDFATGELVAISSSTIGVVSDIDFDYESGNLYGLINNTNQLAVILSNGGAYDQYQVVGNINNLGANYIAKGLTLSGPQDSPQLVIAATQAIAGNAQVYGLPFAAGNATLMTVVTPAAQLATGHCALGYDINYDKMFINRRAAAGFGVNEFSFNLPLANNTASIFWGATGYNFEDLTTTR